MSDVRTNLISLRLSPDEQARAERVAEHYGLNVASLVRMLVIKHARELGLSEPVTLQQGAAREVAREAARAAKK